MVQSGVASLPFAAAKSMAKSEAEAVVKSQISSSLSPDRLPVMVIPSSRRLLLSAASCLLSLSSTSTVEVVTTVTPYS